MSEELVDILIGQYEAMRHELEVHMNGVENFLSRHPELNVSGAEVVHSVKKRMKNSAHLRAKIEKKLREGEVLLVETFFERFTDLCGVRLLMLFQSDFAKVDEVIRKRVQDGDWFLAEQPKAYSWDPETVEYFKKFDLEVITKITMYTSVHYLIRPRQLSPLCCELQVRTVFEEIWGEVDHRLNYPKPTENRSIREQIRVLSKIVGAGSRMLDSIQTSLNEEPLP